MWRQACGAMAAVAMCCSCGGGGGGRSGYEMDAALASAIPADTVTLGGGRLDLLQKSPLYVKLQPMMPGEGLDSLAKRFGVDPRKDVREFVTAYNGRVPLMLAAGSLRTDDLLTKLAGEAGATRSDYKKHGVVSRGGTGVAALSANAIAAGPVERLRECIDRVEARAQLDTRWSQGLAALPGQAQVWFLSAGGATLDLPRGNNIANLDKILASVERLTAWADVSKNVKVSATAVATGENEAKALVTQLRGIIGLGRLSTPDNRPELLKLFDAIKVNQQDRQIEFGVEVPESTVSELLKSVTK